VRIPDDLCQAESLPTEIMGLPAKRNEKMLDKVLKKKIRNDSAQE